MILNYLYKSIFLIISSLLFSANLYCQKSIISKNDSVIYFGGFKNSLAIKPIDLFVSIYAIQYERQISIKDEIIFGLYYIGNNENAYPGKYKFCSPMIGYRKYIWKGLHAEYILLPGYANYYDTIVKKSFNSFEVWNEFHLGYKFEFKISGVPFFIAPQALLGFCLYRSNQPQSFKTIDDKPENYIPNKLYIFPNINFGFRF